jgi:hypothetical protein
MSSNLNRTVAPLAIFIGMALLPLASHADDGGGDYNFPASNVVNEPLIDSASPSCAEASRTAWFNRQVEISDGDVSPTIPMPAECQRAVFAQADSDEAK